MIINIPAAAFGLCTIASSPTVQSANFPPPPFHPINFPAEHPLEDLPGAALTPFSGAINSSVAVCNPFGEAMFVGPMWPAVSAGWTVARPPASVPSLVATNLRALGKGLG